MDAETREKLLYLLGFMNEYIEKSVDEVLNDSEVDPQYSAVTASNLIKCYSHVMKALGKEQPYADVKGYFESHWLDEKDYQAFMASAEKESAYYVGEIF